MKPEEPIGIFQQADTIMMAVQEAQTKAEIKNAAIRHADRMAQYTAWVDPKAIVERKRRHEAEAAQALERAKRMASLARAELGLPAEEPPLPADKDLPPHMRGQSPSTIRAMLRHERGGTVMRGFDSLDGLTDAKRLFNEQLDKDLKYIARILQAPEPRRVSWLQRIVDWIRS